MRWSEFEAENLELAESGTQLFTQFGVGLGFLATIRPDGAPRLHPMCPVFEEGGLFAFIVPGPKQRDLRRDPRYAMHSFPPEEVDDEFCVSGRATEITVTPTVEALTAAYHTAIPDGSTLFEFDLDRALLARYRSRGDWPPTYTVWRAQR